MALSRNITILTLLFGTVITSMKTVSVKACENNETILLENMLKNYNKKARPVINSAEPINIKVEFLIQLLNALDETRQIMSTNLAIFLEWQDEFLEWEPSEYGGLNFISLPPDTIWIPDITFRANMNEDMFTRRQTEFKHIPIKSNGVVRFESIGLVEIICSLKMDSFPFDEHLCFIELMPFSNDMHRILLNLDPNSPQILGDAFTNLFGLNQYSVCNFNQSFSGINKSFSTVKIKLHISRRSTKFVWSLLLPVNLLAFVAMLGFALPAASGEKVSLAITVLLSFTVFQSNIENMMPKNSSSLPLLVIFVGLVMILTTISLIVAVLVSRLEYGKHERPPPIWLDKLFRRKAATITTPIPEQTKENDNHVDFNNHQKERNNTALWHDVAVLIDKVCLVIFMTAYIILTVNVVALSVTYQIHVKDDPDCGPWIKYAG